jgi:maltooligosyltrehalose trehalohydrolase
MQDRVRLQIDGQTLQMRVGDDGWWRTSADALPGTDYAYLLGDDDTPRPDPRSAWQPAGVHGRSRVYDHGTFDWTDAAWTGRPLPGSVIYELHIGTFTPDGTFDAAIERLDHLVDLGIDLVELLPVNAFNGEHNWGYDGVCWYAPHERYGGPDGLKRLIDAAHARGLGVLLDVVYNHFGPSGAYAPMFAPYLAETGNTWGRSLNLDGPHSDEVRRYIIDSALMWLRDYHADGLRIDAVHALVDHRATHVLEQLSAEVDVLAAHLRRPLTLIAESDLNDARLVMPREAGGYGLTAQWDDDAHHAMHALLTGERQGYYVDFGGLDVLAKVWQEAFFHDGTYSAFRERTHGRPVDRTRTPGYRFVTFLQDHDQIGNRALGDRLAATLPVELLKVGAVLLLTAPFTPMLFMGEEWAAATPWLFFTSHPEPELAEAVGRGRRAEFGRHGWPASDVPDPQDPATFARSKLDWSERTRGRHAEMLAFYRDLIALRRRVPDLCDPRLDRVRVVYGPSHLVIRRGHHYIVMNFAPYEARIDTAAGHATVVFATEQPVSGDGGSVVVPGRSATIIAVDGAGAR